MHDLHLLNNERWDCSDFHGIVQIPMEYGMLDSSCAPIRKSQEVLKLVILVAKELDHHIRSICWDTCHLKLDVQQ